MRKVANRCFRTLVVLAGFLVGISVLLHPTVASASTNSGNSSYATAPKAPKGAEVVYVGIEPIQAYAVSLETDTFQTSFYIWWRWRGPIDPCPTTDVLNSTNASSNYITDYSFVNSSGQETPTVLKNGEKYQTAKISVGIADPFSVSRYPLDHQDLEIRIENNTYDFQQLIYVPDLTNMSPHPHFVVAGWNVTGEYMSSYLHRYGTNFGLVGEGNQASQYSQITYNVNIARPASHFVMKLFLPMFVVLIAALTALLVRADHFDVRLAMAGTGLLTFIFLQQGYSGDLPSTAPVVLMDEIYVMAYCAVGITFLRVIYTTTRIHHSAKEPEIFVRGDRIIALLTAVTFLAGSLVLVFL